MTSSQAYVGTAQRTFAQAIGHLLETAYAVLGSGRVLDMLAPDVNARAEQFYPLPERLRSGWMVFTGGQATGHKAYPGQAAADHELGTLAWLVSLAEDLEALATMPKGKAGNVHAKPCGRNASRALASTAPNTLRARSCALWRT